MSPAINSFILERAFKALKLPKASLAQLTYAADLADVDGDGFPPELLHLSLPVIVRGLLNFSVLQMHRDWVYPFWVHQQLDPTSQGFIPRSQNPLLINVTNRSWTCIGSPEGEHEAVVDPRGLLTPLPREWSVDTWLKEGEEMFFPSLHVTANQTLDTKAPQVTTSFLWRDLRLRIEAFVGVIRGGRDVLFCRAVVRNDLPMPRHLQLCVALRPFGPEGVAPIETIVVKSKRIISVDGCTGVVFNRDPDSILFGNHPLGDVAAMLQGSEDIGSLSSRRGAAGPAISCPRGMATAAVVFNLNLPQNHQQSISYSLALGDHSELSRARAKATWKVSYEKRRKEQQESWKKELDGSASFEFGNERLQELFEASRITLLQLHDGEEITPGPYLYHKFWFRDAAPMVRALDVLGFHRRTRQVIEGFSKRMTSDGFFRAPSGEWDSNGAVLWSVIGHYRLTRSLLWARKLYPTLRTAAQWIVRMRSRTRDTDSEHRGLMPRSLSAEHLGTVDQYYWDSFWSLAGLEAFVELSRELGYPQDARRFESEVREFRVAIMNSFHRVEQRLGVKLIPSAPMRSFDESAIGSICCLYPLNLFDSSIPHPEKTLRTLIAQFVDERGFFHPIIHSGYNPYLTLQLAHALLLRGDCETAWSIAESIFRQASQTFAFPEAIHPRTGGGSMGDGHHGWAAAEIVLFLRDAVMQEAGNSLQLFGGSAARLLRKERSMRVGNAPTSYGTLSVTVDFESSRLCRIKLVENFTPGNRPESVDFHIPWKVTKVSPSNPSNLLSLKQADGHSIVSVVPQISHYVLTLES